MPYGIKVDYHLSFQQAYPSLLIAIGQKYNMWTFRVFEDISNRSQDLPSYAVDVRLSKPRVLWRTQSIQTGFRVLSKQRTSDFKFPNLIRAEVPKGSIPIFIQGFELGTVKAAVDMARLNFDDTAVKWSASTQIGAIGAYTFGMGLAPEVRFDRSHAVSKTIEKILDSLSFRHVECESPTTYGDLYTINIFASSAVCEGDVVVASNTSFRISYPDLILLRPHATKKGSTYYTYVGPGLLSPSHEQENHPLVLDETAHLERTIWCII